MVQARDCQIFQMIWFSSSPNCLFDLLKSPIILHSSHFKHIFYSWSAVKHSNCSQRAICVEGYEYQLILRVRCQSGSLLLIENRVSHRFPLLFQNDWMFDAWASCNIINLSLSKHVTMRFILSFTDCFFLSSCWYRFQKSSVILVSNMHFVLRLMLKSIDHSL